MFSFPIHGRRPAVERMFFHLIGENPVVFADNQRMEHVLEKPSVTESMFTSWFKANANYSEARKLTYGQFVSKFVYHKKNRCWTPRKREFTIRRLIWVPPCTGELFYLRMMLTVVKGPLTYEQLKNVAGVQLLTFREACFALGFLGDDQEFISAIQEANNWGSGHALRYLFVVLLLSNIMDRPKHVWEKTWHWLADGILYIQRRIANNPNFGTEQKEFGRFQKILERNRRSLADFKPMPYPKDYITAQLGNRLIYDERNYNAQKLKQEFDNLYKMLTDEQRMIFNKIMKAVEDQKGGVFFLHGYGGTGKTFMWQTLASALRCKLKIVLTVASSGITSLLLPGGRTAHSKFKIPVPTDDNSTCNIEFDSDHAELLQQTKFIIWDEAPMTHKFFFQALDRTLKDVMSEYSDSDKNFGGKVFVFGGDFRHILPVIPRRNRSEIVHASINASDIWDHCQVLTLTRNMRLTCG
ncbi:uncharacterized protein [Medicago truncatula]|uniref:ATP-dependent DNA helicase n=1 Tax=Medicago truncatula TaxID=3880 RepID=G7JX51_MEDTR|nr:uncharacterized protein LOC11430106 [Medicago truncatula]AES97392.2 PIF1-like helicase [Medicago truncatula]